MASGIFSQGAIVAHLIRIAESIIQDKLPRHSHALPPFELSKVPQAKAVRMSTRICDVALDLCSCCHITHTVKTPASASASVMH